MKLANTVRFSKEKSYKYIDLTDDTFEEYFEKTFFGRGSPSEFNYGHSLSYNRGRGRPKSDWL